MPATSKKKHQRMVRTNIGNECAPHRPSINAEMRSHLLVFSIAEPLQVKASPRQDCTLEAVAADFRLHSVKNVSQHAKETQTH